MEIIALGGGGLPSLCCWTVAKFQNLSQTPPSATRFVSTSPSLEDFKPQQPEIISLKRLIACSALGLSLSCHVQRQDSAPSVVPVGETDGPPSHLWRLQAGRVAAHRAPTPLLTGTSLRLYSEPTSSHFPSRPSKSGLMGHHGDEAPISPSSRRPLHWSINDSLENIPGMEIRCSWRSRGFILTADPGLVLCPRPEKLHRQVLLEVQL